MDSLNLILKITFARGVALLVVPVLVISGCATTESTHRRARIEIQEEVGFTITEEVRISGNVRTDYAAALGYLEQDRHEEGVALLETVAEEAPQLSTPRIDLGIAYHRAGNLEAAERNLLLALESNPDHPIAHNELALFTANQGVSLKLEKVTKLLWPFTPVITTPGETLPFSAICISGTWSARSKTMKRIWRRCRATKRLRCG